MAFIVQNESRPGRMLGALNDLLRGGASRVRVCSAYVSLSGSETLRDAIARSARNGDIRAVRTTIVTSMDYGITEPDALRFWSGLPNTTVLVAGAELLGGTHLTPRIAFHPKLYIVTRQDDSVGSLTGSANLTNRGLTVNGEVGWLEMDHSNTGRVDRAWKHAIAPATELAAEMIDRYAELRRRVPPTTLAKELERVPAPTVGPARTYRAFGEADVDPGDYDQMWIQSRGMQGGAGTQLELPRGSHRFFGAQYTDYEFERVEHIADPVLVAGRRRWNDRPLTWHGDNRMERINLPSANNGGFVYANSLILFRRIGENTYELRVHPWDSDAARANVEASRSANLLFRVGRNSDRLVGFLE